MRSRGFTLIELLVALAIFAVLSLLAYGGLASVLDGSDLAGARAERLGELQRAVHRVTDDLAQLAPRPVRDAFGDPQAALRADGGGLEFTRGGWRNPAGRERSTLQRIGYALEERTLVRLAWPVLDRAPGSRPVRQRLLGGVERLEVRFLADRGDRWSASWPPASEPADSPRLPLAIEISLEVDGHGVVTRRMVTGE
ncbi:MAG: type II secretion system minor pseudopilin GspJ [Gammaproteobacteria bacterium]|nr:type II secretion system minor pseudopilin GspJ [Gammaproteobacteria bacterium]